MSQRTKELKKAHRLARAKQLARQKQHQSFQQNLLVGLTFGGYLIIMAISLFKPGIPSGHDITSHLTYSKLFIEALHQGQLPVRWTSWVIPGLGFPLFNFYQVGFYYLVSLVNLAIHPLLWAIKASLFLDWALGATFIYLYARKFGQLAGVVAAGVWSFHPYLLLDLFVRAAFPEFMAICLIPGLLWSLDKVLQTQKSIYIAPLAAFLGLTITCHLPVCLIMLPILGLYTLFNLRQSTWLKSLSYLSVAVALGIGLSSFYLMPAIAELPLIQTQHLTSGRYDFHQHFVYPLQLVSLFWGYGSSFAGDKDGMSFQIGMTTLFVVLTSLIVAFVYKIRKIKLDLQLILFSNLTLIYVTLIMLPWALPVWEKLRFLQYVQYPWRFLMAGSFISALLTGFLLSKLKGKLKVIFLILTLGLAGFYLQYLHPQTYYPETLFKIDSPDWKKSDGVSKYTGYEQGYLPQQVKQLPKENPGRWSIKGDAGVTVSNFSNTQEIFNVSSTNSIDFRLNEHYFPGWKAFVDSKPTEIHHNNDLDYMIVRVPGAGLHQVGFKFFDTPVRAWGNRITILSLLLILLLPLSFISKLRFYFEKGSKQPT